MKTISDEKEFFSNLTDLLAAQLGALCEVALFDIRGNEASLAELRNGDVTGGRDGLIKTMMQDVPAWKTLSRGQITNQICTMENGTILRCSAVMIRDEDGEVIGCLFFNQNISDLLSAERVIHNLNQYHGDPGTTFIANIRDVLISMIEEAQDEVHVPYEKMTKQDKLRFLKYLDERGAFLVTKAGDLICSLLAISKYTMYAYLDIVRSEGNQTGL